MLAKNPDFIVPDYALTQRELWTPKLVMDALVDAYRLLRHSPRVGPRGNMAFWPEYFEAGDYPPEKTKTSPYRTRMSATRMEMVVTGWKGAGGKNYAPWLAGPLLAVPEYGAKLEAWVKAELRGESDKDLCERKKWSVATYKRHRVRAATIVARRLNEAAVEVWR